MQQIAAPQPPFDVIKTATDRLLLPLRRPILFVPFVFTMLLLVALVAIVFVGTFAAVVHHAQVSAPQIIALLGTVALMIVTSMLAIEVITDLTARAELGHDVVLGDAVAHALSRFPATLATAALMSVAVFVGTMLLIVPGLIVATRWLLAMTAVLLSGRGVREAFGTSWRLTGAYFIPLFGLLLAVTVATVVLAIPLSHVPVFGQLAAAWLGFGWGAIALTMAYIRLGGPVDLR